MEKKPIISIIIPVYNMEEYLEHTIGSLLKQTFRNIEILCIDDASTDSSLKILEDLKNRDKRIKVYGFAENKSAWAARMLGIREAKGRYIMFMDADDCLAPEACYDLLKEMKRDPVDILHFKSEVINVNQQPEARIKSVKNFLKPFAGRLKGKSILTACFLEKKYGFTLWNKLFRTAVCKKAFEGMDEAWLPRGQDKLTYFLIAYYARSYRGISGKPYYQYYFGRGSVRNEFLNIQQFGRFCTMGHVADKLRDFLESKNSLQEYAVLEKEFRQDLLNDCGSIWGNRLAEQDKSDGFDLMLKYWRAEEIVTFLSSNYVDRRYELTKQLQGSRCLQYDGRPIKTIAAYYHSIENGSVARETCSLVKLWTEIGYRVVLITDSPASEKDCNVPENVSRFIVPDFHHISGENYGERAKALHKIITDNQVELVVYHAWMSQTILWDELTIKSSGCAFVPHCHSIFSFELLSPWIRYQDIIAPFMLADGVITLSEIDTDFWSQINNNVHAIINPFVIDMDDWVASDCSNHDILWVGGLSDEKLPDDALEIIKIVGQSIPDAKLHILGESKEDYEEYYRERINKLGIQDRVILHRYNKDVKSYYEKASVLLMTSRYEGFPIILQEGMLAGLPIVMYELQYPMLAKENPGIISVRQGDMSAAADALISLLQDDLKRKKLGKSSREYINRIAEHDYVETWKSVFAKICTGHQVRVPDSAGIIMTTLIKQHDEGLLPRNGNGVYENAFYLDRKTVKMGVLIAKAIDSYRDRGLLETAKRIKERISSRL